MAATEQKVEMQPYRRFSLAERDRRWKAIRELMACDQTGRARRAAVPRQLNGLAGRRTLHLPLRLAPTLRSAWSFHWKVI